MTYSIKRDRMNEQHTANGELHLLWKRTTFSREKKNKKKITMLLWCLLRKVDGKLNR